MLRQRISLCFWMALFLLSCKNTITDNACDPNGRKFIDSVLLKWISLDSSPTCGKVYVSAIPKEILEYSIPSLGVVGIISGNQIVITSETIVSISSYVANFKTNGISVSIDGVEQISGVSSNSYASPLKYIVTAVDGSTKEYTVQMIAPRILGSGSLRLWFKADQLTLNDGDGITTWSDLSGYGNHVAQANAIQRPVFRVNQVNGLPAAQFRSSFVSRMDISSSSVGTYVTASGSVFFVMRLVQTIPGGVTLLNLDSTGGREFSIDHPSPEYLLSKNGTGFSAVSGFPLPKTIFLALGSVQVLTNTAREYWNGNLKGQTPVSYDYGGGTNSILYLGNGNLDADIAEVLYFNTDLSEAEVQKLYFYLNTKYGLSPL